MLRTRHSAPPLVMALVLALAPAAPLLAQEDDRDYLTAFLEDSLSGAGRKVTVEGFAGALSARATIDRLTIADDTGVWLALDGVVLDWSQSALLSGRVEVAELSAATITLNRLPEATGDSAVPAPEAGGFALPELPVSVRIDKVSAPRIVLGAAVLGEPVEASLSAAARLEGGEGAADLRLTRLDDGPAADLTLEAAFSNETGRLTLDLTASEREGGIAARRLGLPGTPATDLSVQGAGPLSDFSARLALRTDGVDRLSGTVTLREGEDGHGFNADVAGDLAPLFLPDYAAFFGPSITLNVDGIARPSGAVDLSQFALTTRALSLEGALRLAPDGLPRAFDLTARLGLPDGAPVLLPLSGDPVRLTGADIALRFDAAQDDGWSGSANLTGLQTVAMTLAQARLDGSGRIGRAAGGRTVGATLDLAAQGITPADPALAAALGPDITGAVTLFWREGADALSLPVLRIGGADYDLLGRLSLSGLDDALRMQGAAEVTAADLSRFSALAGRDLGGAGRIDLSGSGSTLAGDFDLQLRAQTQDLVLGLGSADRLTTGQASLALSVRRDASGTDLRTLTLDAAGITARASGRLSSAESALVAEVAVPDLAPLGLRGAVSLRADLVGSGLTGEGQRATLALTGQGRNLASGAEQADRLLAGNSSLSARLLLQGDRLTLEEGRIATPRITAEASGTLAGGPRGLAISARLADLAVLLPEFPGAVTLRGRLDEAGDAYRLNLRGQGPGQIDATLAGTLSPGFDRSDLTLRGTAQAGLANVFLDPAAVSGPLGFDLRLAGAPSLAALSGRVTLSGGRITEPGLALSLERVEALATLSGGQVRIAATAQLPRGGRLRLDGPVGLTAPYAGDLSLQGQGLRLRDPELFDTTADAALTVTGPLAGGARIAGTIDLGQTDLRIPSTGFGGAGDLPGLRHVNEPADVRATRFRAGQDQAGEEGAPSASGPAYALDVTLRAPSRIFLRGRGLDAELGGSLRLGGTTAAIVPSGGFDLIRGRIDILGKRLTLSTASLRLEGDFIPWVEVAAENAGSDVISIVRIDGPASDPDVTFTSVPELPQEEVLAQLLFGRGMQNISALQAAQLANAVATLAGRGGEGVIGRLRRGFGLDDLDVQTAEDGTASVTAGKYISEKVYTQVEIDQSGSSAVSLNLDLRPGVTVKGSVDSTGESGIGIFVEKDY